MRPSACASHRVTLSAVLVVLFAVVLAGCGTTTLLRRTTSTTVTTGASGTPSAGSGLPSPVVVTRNTSRFDGADPVSDAAGVALAVYPSAAPGTHPKAVTIAPTASWQAAIASSVLMAPPIGAPVLLSGPGTLPAVTAQTLRTLAPTGAGVANGAQVIRIGQVPSVSGHRVASVTGSDPYTVAAAIDRLASAAAGKPSSDVVVASAADPQYAMPAAGWAAESGDPILYVSPSGVPPQTRQALQAHGKPHIYVLGPASAVSDGVVKQLGRYGTVKRVGDTDSAANSVAFAAYRDPACPFGQPCAHVPNSFGWAIRSPGHGYVLLNAARPLDAAASAALSGSGDFGPQLLVENPSTLPRAVLTYFLDYATPGYTQEGPTAAVYNHGWLIGNPSAISVSVQAEVDNLLQAVPQTSK